MKYPINYSILVYPRLLWLDIHHVHHKHMPIFMILKMNSYTLWKSPQHCNGTSGYCADVTHSVTDCSARGRLCLLSANNWINYFDSECDLGVGRKSCMLIWRSLLTYPTHINTNYPYDYNPNSDIVLLLSSRSPESTKQLTATVNTFQNMPLVLIHLTAPRMTLTLTGAQPITFARTCPLVLINIRQMSASYMLKSSIITSHNFQH